MQFQNDLNNVKILFLNVNVYKCKTDNSADPQPIRTDMIHRRMRSVGIFALAIYISVDVLGIYPIYL